MQYSFSVFYRKRQFIKLVRTYKRNVCFFIFTNDQLETSSHQAIIHM